MNARLTQLILILTLSGSLSAGDVQLGHDQATVLKQLGKPIGTIELREKTLLLYPQGEVMLKNGLVSEIDLMSDEAFAADQERLQQEREEWLIAQEKRAEARQNEGEAIKANKMQSRAFSALPAKERVDYWRSFQIRYPEVDVSEAIATALEGYQTELEELRNQHRITELEARVALAEQEAAKARLETEKLREETVRTQSNQRYGLRYYTDPVRTHSRYLYRPPTVTIYTNGEKTTHSSQAGHYHNYDQRRQTNEGVAERVTRILNEAQKD